MAACIALAGLLLGAGAFAQTCAVPGWDGPATPAGVVNTYHAGAATAGAGASSISVNSVAGQRTNTRSLRAGDLILIIQMQDAASPATAGRHEYAQITSVAGTTLNLNRTLTNTYSRSITGGSIQSWQAVWVPQYSSAVITGTVSADRWAVNNAAGTGYGTGGIVAMDVAGSLALNGTITVAGSGFRGGAGLNGTGNRASGAYTDGDYAFTTTVASMNGAIKGEGIEGTPIVVFNGTVTPVNYFALYGQGYALGSGGRNPRSNAGGAANDGDPTGTVTTYGGNQLNSGGGGGGNRGAGGMGGNSWNQNMTTASLNTLGAGNNTGNVAGGLGGTAQTPSATRLIMGGGGGAGSANNGSTDSIGNWPPTASGSVANGAGGPISSSGASGGGIVLVRAGTFSASAGVVDASGSRPYTKSPTGDTDAAGGGGAGGSVSIRAVSGAGAGLTINANGGDGGSSDYFNHGPGGGGGGGYVLTSFTGATINVAGGLNGTDGCCSGGTGNGSPKAYNSQPGSAGASATTDGTPAGVADGASCLPVVVATKSTTTPLITSATGASATYSINLSNTGGAATNLFVFDASLPPGWAYTSTPASTYTFSPAPPPGAGSNAAGADAIPASLPGGLPASTASSVNAGAAVSLTTTPGVVPSTGNNSLTFGSFFLPQNASITITFAATIPDQATAGTYHNPAGVVYLDPTRTAAGGNRLVSPLANVNANRTTTAYSANTTFQSGPAGNVPGSNSSGLQGGPTTEDVTLVPDLSVTKTGSSGTFTLGASGQQYVIVARNNGRPIADQSYGTTQATTMLATAVASTQLTVTDTLPAGISVTSLANSNSPTWACTVASGSATFTCSASGIYPLAAASNLVTITATVTVGVAACPGPLVNTATFTTAAIGESSTANNTATAAVSVGCSTSLTVTKTDNVTAVKAGGTTSYTVTFANLGPAAADGATVKDAPGTGLSCTVGSCTANGGASCPAPAAYPNLLASGVALPLLPNGGSALFVVNCNVTATGQ